MANPSEQSTLFGHPTGLFTLFFAEMWERFSYYGMRALLVLYMLKGFLEYGDEQAYTVYGAYTALVYMTPFIGGMLADRVLGQRRAVVIGGALMAAGHLLMTIESQWPFFFALALLIVGNGFFKPNISSMVGTLYAEGSPKRDDGFNIFYMGINLGAAMSPLLCGYVGETYGWHYGFGLATIGMLVGLAVFVMPNRITQALILAAAIASAVGLFVYRPDNPYAVLINIFIGGSLLLAAVMACLALNKGGLPNWTGVRPETADGSKDWMVYLGIVVSVPIFALLVSGFAPFRADGKSLTLINASVIENLEAGGGLGVVAATFLSEVSKPAGLVLTVLGALAFGYLIRETLRMTKVPRERMVAALVLIFFQMLFFAFFEQAGSSINNFTDRNVDRVGQSSVVTQDMVGTTIQLQPTQEQLGYELDGEVFTLTALDELRKENTDPAFEIDWQVTENNVGMGIATRGGELPASIFQSVNPGFILIFALLFNLLWAFLRRSGLDPSAPVKFALALAQLGLGFLALWYGAQNADERGMVAITWLFIGYLLQTTGELCLSPVGLSTMTKLSPKVLVSTLMGAWFLATAFSQYLAAIISQFTGVSHGGNGGASVPPPIETLHVYGDVFNKIGMTALVCAVICLALSPLLTKWMHLDQQTGGVES